jgi:hypothetical protein
VHKCKDCGLVAFNDKVEPGPPLELDEPAREKGHATGILEKRANWSIPLCLARAWPLKKELDEEPKDIDGSVNLLTVLSKPRECPRFMPWQQGFGPKEHLEMGFLELAQERAKAADEKRLAEQREWQQRVDHERAERAATEKKADLERIEYQRTVDRREKFTLIVLGAAISAAIGYFTKSH